MQPYFYTLTSDNKEVVSNRPLIVNIIYNYNFTYIRNAYDLIRHFTIIHFNPTPKNYYKFLALSKLIKSHYLHFM